VSCPVVPSERLVVWSKATRIYRPDYVQYAYTRSTWSNAELCDLGSAIVPASSSSSCSRVDPGSALAGLSVKKVGGSSFVHETFRAVNVQLQKHHATSYTHHNGCLRRTEQEAQG
jgi:hypothetical protein